MYDFSQILRVIHDDKIYYNYAIAIGIIVYAHYLMFVSLFLLHTNDNFSIIKLFYFNN